MSDYNILVTGVGAVIGYGIVNSLRRSRYDLHIVGADIYPDAVGQNWCDAFVQAERADSDGFEDYMLSVIAEHGIDLVIPGIEQDVDRCREIIVSIHNAGSRVALNSDTALDVFNNKSRTYDLLCELGLPYMPYIESAATTIEGLHDKIGMPCILKKKVSYAGKGLRLIERVGEAELYIGDDEYLFQKYEKQGQEYTVSVFGLGDGTFASPIALKRTLGPDGATHKASTTPFAVFRRDVEFLCKQVAPVGPTNFQFIEDESGVSKLLEVNPRISSSTSIREKFGVNEAEMCIDYYIEGRRPLDRKVMQGSAQRYIDEIVTYDSDNL